MIFLEYSVFILIPSGTWPLSVVTRQVSRAASNTMGGVLGCCLLGSRIERGENCAELGPVTQPFKAGLDKDLKLSN